MQIIQDRRALHRIPELGLQLPKTVGYVTGQLENLGCQVFFPVDSCVCAFFDRGCSQTLAFRGDMDALPMTEHTGLEFASAHPGMMHACGHDGHTAILLEFARHIRELETKYNILLIFQPGEENPGGAEKICKTGLLQKYRVAAIFGLHLWPGLEKGALYSRRGAMMSRSCEVDVTVHGVSAHIGKAHQGKDALAAGLRFYREAVAMEQAMDPEVFRLLKFGRMESGSVRNAISDYTRLEGSLRTFDDGVFAWMRQKLLEVAAETEAATGCPVEVSMNEGYPAVHNPEELYEKVRKLVTLQELEAPSLTSEDFSWYQKEVPGMFFFLGLGDVPALHTPEFDFDESVLEEGVRLFAQLAAKY